jgi:hypothetical protein
MIRITRRVQHEAQQPLATRLEKPLHYVVLCPAQAPCLEPPCVSPRAAMRVPSSRHACPLEPPCVSPRAAMRVPSRHGAMPRLSARLEASLGAGRTRGAGRTKLGGCAASYETILRSLATGGPAQPFSHIRRRLQYPPLLTILK